MISKNNMQTQTLTYVRNFIFGAEDSLVSTVGLLAGITAGGLGRSEIILTGIVLIIVEGLSMGVGSYLSEYTTEESEVSESQAFQTSLKAALIMFVSYIVLGLIPLAPFIFLNTTAVAMPTSVAISLFSLLILGLVSAKFLKTKVIRSMLRMIILGGIAIGAGLLIGINFH